MASFGAGSMLSALIIPRLLDQVADRKVMSLAAIAVSLVTLLHGLIYAALGPLDWPVFLLLWAVTGMFYSAVLTPSGRLLRRSAQPEDRPAVFTAQFALSHACWLITYPLAGWVATLTSMPVALILLGALAAVATLLGLRLWTPVAPEGLEHDHLDLPADHPHLQEFGGGRRHAHVFVIDDEHRAWPTQG